MKCTCKIRVLQAEERVYRAPTAPSAERSHLLRELLLGEMKSGHENRVSENRQERKACSALESARGVVFAKDTVFTLSVHTEP